MSYKTEQEAFWAGQFGDEYIDRNTGHQYIASNLALFAKALARTHGIQSILEIGANIGQNIRALQHLKPLAQFSAVEINQKAAEKLQEIPGLQVYNQSILDFNPSIQFDFVFSKGVLIHLDPQILPEIYKKIYEHSSKYICLIEYFNPTPMTLEYREHQDKLFKRDFAGEMMDLYPDLELVDYGFTYRRDPNFRLDNSTWFLLKKNPS